MSDTQGVPGDPGERGKHGDHGQQGEVGQQGVPGLQGLIGERGIIGERGRQGDHGQEGARGIQGQQGTTGSAGVAGSAGSAGGVGPKGESFSRKQMLVMYALMIVMFLLLAWRSEVNGARIDRNSDRILADRYTVCIASHAIIEQFNDFNRQMIDIEKNNKFINDEIRRDRIRAYNSAIIKGYPDCKPRP